MLIPVSVYVVTYLVLALAGMALLARTGFVTRDGSKNRIRPAAMLVAAVINLAVMAAEIALHLRWFGTLADLRIAARTSDAFLTPAFTALALIAGAAYARSHGAVWRRWQLDRATVCALAGGIGALACAALMEEVVFRALVMNALAPAGAWASVCVSAGVFAVIHVATSRTTPAAFIAWAIGGVVFGVLWACGLSIWAVAAAHFGRNVANALFVDPSADYGVATPARKSTAWRRVALYGVTGALTVCLGLVSHAG